MEWRLTTKFCDQDISWSRKFVGLNIKNESLTIFDHEIGTSFDHENCWQFCPLWNAIPAGYPGKTRLRRIAQLRKAYFVTIHCMLYIALFPGLPRLQFLIACKNGASKQSKTGPGKAWERGYTIHLLCVQKSVLGLRARRVCPGLQTPMA